jgi:hypothetical protein
MDLNYECAAHQRALIGGGAAANDGAPLLELEKASRVARRISAFQHGLGAAAACAWSKAQFTAPAQAR